MINFKDALRLLFVLIAYGLSGHLDHVDETQLAQGLTSSPAALRAPKCPLPAVEESLVENTSGVENTVVSSLTSERPANSINAESVTAQRLLNWPCLPDGL